MRNFFKHSYVRGQDSRCNGKGGAAKSRASAKTTTTVVTFLAVLMITLFAGNAYAQPALTLDKTGIQSLDAAYGYDPAPVVSVKIENTGNAATGALTVTLSGVNAGDFELSETSFTDLAAGDNTSFTVYPKGGLTVNGGVTYNATVTVSGSGLSATFDVEFTVNKRTVTMADFDYNPKVVSYNGAVQAADITPKITGMSLNIVYYNEEIGWTSAPTEAYPYVVAMYVAENADFNPVDAANLWFGNILTINKALLTLTTNDFDVSGPTSVTYDGAAHAPIITAKDPSLTVSIAYCDWNNGQTWSSSPPVDAGLYVVVASASNRNYQSDNVWG
ncbi:MAG: MBG domain-containing protein, partial [Tannerella sp.]|nr:MBG domain-containing protein [Tannerella sp.]